MRPFLSTLFAAGLTLGAVAPALADACARPVEKVAFDVAGLKSELMVTAIACKVQDKYNMFVIRYRSDLVMHERALNTYFQRANGRRAQQQHDDYITSLANTQSEDAIKSGTLFCAKNVGMFDEVLGLKDGKQLPSFAAGKAPVQPMLLIDCPLPAVKTTRTASASSKKG